MGSDRENLLRQITEIMNNDNPLDAQGHYRGFSYRGGDPSWLVSHNLMEHRHKDILKERRDAIFTSNPPFTLEQFKSSVLSILERWNEKEGEHEFKDSDPHIDPLDAFKEMKSFVSPVTLVDLTVNQVEGRKNCSIVGCSVEKGDVVGHLVHLPKFHIDFEKKKVTFSTHVEIVWVSPEYRGLAYGANLGMVCGEICAVKLIRVARLLPYDWTIDALVTADYDSFGGKAVVERVFSIVEGAFDVMKDCESTKCRIGMAELDAGF